MSESRSEGEPQGEQTVDPVSRYGEITRELRELEHKTDPESRHRFMVLIEQLMCADMALQPYRKAMGRKQPDPPA